ncbi:MAG: hypothetical protein V2A73_18300, partial [Pseudomonadota bacterium]
PRRPPIPIEDATSGGLVAWRKAVAAQARIAVQTAGSEASAESMDSRSQNSDLLCLLTYDDELQLWSMAADRLLASVPLGSVAGSTVAPAQSASSTAKSAKDVPTMAQLAATRHGCLVLTGGRALLFEGSALVGMAASVNRGAGQDGLAVRELAGKASAVAFQAGRILVATNERALIFDENGNELARVSVEQGASAIGLIDGGRMLVVGYDAGDIVLLPIDPSVVKPGFSFEETLPLTVERISEGPRQTLIVGDNVGNVGIWHLQTGKRLRHFKLHGPVAHLLVDNESRRLYVATEVGDFRAIDLAALYRDYCELLVDVWNNVPVVWRAGMPALAMPPAIHRCAVASRSTH